MIVVRIQPAYDAWHEAARRLLRVRTPPAEVLWDDGVRTLLAGLAADGEAPAERERGGERLMVPRRFVRDARWVAAHSDASRWDLLYRVLWRTLHENRRLLDIAVDREVAAFNTMLAETHRDEHKMRAFVRFRRIVQDDGERYIAWHRPDHHVVPLAAPFFAERFASMRWSILTPDECVHWNGETLDYTPGVDRSAAPAGDELEELWRAYYASVFNPARVNLKAMRAEMPVRHWGTLPEAQLIPSLVAEAASRVAAFGGEMKRVGARIRAEDTVADVASQGGAHLRGLPAVRTRHADRVRRGSLRRRRSCWSASSRGTRRIIKGRPFVGPAGGVLNRALAAAGIARASVYVTNAVKHFSWEPRGKRRIHKTPRRPRCRPAVRGSKRRSTRCGRPPLVALGSMAARTLFGPQFRVLRERGQIRETPWAERTVATLHPSAVLRADTPEVSDQYFGWIVADLKLAVAKREREPASALRCREVIVDEA